MVRIDERYKSQDSIEDVGILEAEHALAIANEYDGGNISDLVLLLGRTGEGAVDEALRRGWLMKDDVNKKRLHITTAGRDYYLLHLKDSSRHLLEYKMPSHRDEARTSMELLGAGLEHAFPREHIRIEGLGEEQEPFAEFSGEITKRI